MFSELQGGKFGHGFVSAGLTKAINVNNIFGTSANLRGVRIAAAAVIGGTISKVTGGKFSNGAITAAFAQAFNGEAEAKEKELLKFQAKFDFKVKKWLKAGLKADSDGLTPYVQGEKHGFKLSIDSERKAVLTGKSGKVKFDLSERDLDYLVSGVTTKDFEFKKLQINLGVDNAGRMTYKASFNQTIFGIGAKWSFGGAVDIEAALLKTTVGKRFEFYGRGWMDKVNKAVEEQTQ